MKKDPQKNKQALIFITIMSVFLAWIGVRLGMLCGSTNWTSKLGYAFDNLFSDITKNPFAFSMTNAGFVFALIFAGAAWLFYVYNFLMPKPEKVGIEHGSSRWATDKEMSDFKNLSIPDKNIVFSNNSGLAIVPDKNWDQEHKIDATRNLNVAVIGGSGSGKTRFFVKPNLMQLQGNYFVTDPKGTLIEECGHLMADNGYEIKSFNVIPDTMNQSLCYNPLYYVHSYEQILAFVNCLMKNTEDQKKQGGDDFWPKAEKLLYISILSYMLDFCPREEFTLPKLNEYIGLAKAMEEDETFESPLDIIFKEVETGYMYVKPGEDSHADRYIKQKFNKDVSTDNSNQNNYYNLPGQHKVKDTKYYGADVVERKDGFIDVPTCLTRNGTGFCPWDEFEKNGKEPKKDDFEWSNEFCVIKYKQFKSAAGKTLKSIIISCNARLAPLDIPEVKRILNGKVEKRVVENYGEKPYIEEVATGKCEMELDKLGDKDRKMCIFVIMSDTNDTYFFLVAMMMYQLLDALCNVALSKYGGALPNFVNLYLDEFANLGVLPDFNRTIAITRSRNIGISMILQTPFQLETNYKKEEAKTIMDNCDTVVYLGGGSVGANESTCKEISERLGKETIHTRTFNRTRGRQGSTTENNAIQARDLMMPDEVFRLPRADCLIMIKNAYPYKDKKFVLEEHERYSYIDPEAHNKKYKHLRKHTKNFKFLEYIKKQDCDTEKELELAIEKWQENMKTLDDEARKRYEFSLRSWNNYYEKLENEVDTLMNQTNNKNLDVLETIQLIEAKQCNDTKKIKDILTK